MAKSSYIKIEEDKKAVLELLQRRSNETIDNIAKELGFSRQKVWRIIKRMDEVGTIWGYTAIFDDEEFGLKHFIALMKELPTIEVTDVTIESTYYVNGWGYNWVVTFTAPDIIRAKEFCTDGMLLETLEVVQKQYIKKQKAIRSEKTKKLLR